VSTEADDRTTALTKAFRNYVLPRASESQSSKLIANFQDRFLLEVVAVFRDPTMWLLVRSEDELQRLGIAKLLVADSEA